MSTNINFVNSLGLGSNTRVDFNLPRTILLKGEGRAVADGGVAEAELCSYNTLNGLNYNALLRSASLILTPNSYKEGTLYSVIPSDGSGDMSVVRATTATRVNSAGLVELVPYNLLSWSEQFDNAYWSKGGSTIVANNITAPDGTTTADALVEDTSTGFHQIYTAPTGNANTVYTASIYVKPAGRAQISLTFSGGGFGANRTAFFGLTGNGTVDSTQASVTSASIENVGNGWYRCSVVLDLGAGSGNAFFQVMPTVALSQSYTGNGTVAAYFWGAQLVEGTLPKDYQKTETRLNIPRLDYSNGTCPSLLVEPQRTNLVQYSSSFDTSSYWLPTTLNGSISVTANYGISPDGTQNAERLQLSYNGGAGNYSQIYNTLVTTIGQSYTVSVWLKSLSGTPTILLGYYSGSENNPVTLTNEWVRYTFTFTSNAVLVYPKLAVGFGFSSTSADFLAYGYQVEAGSYPTSYIPTTSASVTRNADVVSKTGISSLIGQTEGTMFLDFVARGGDVNQEILGITLNGGGSEYIALYSLTNGALYFVTNLTGGGVLIDASSFGERFKVAYSFTSGSHVLYVNGVQIYTSTTASTYSLLNALYLGVNAVGAGQQLLNTNSSALWKTRLTNTQLAQLTTI